MSTRHFSTSVDGTRIEPELVKRTDKIYTENMPATKPRAVLATRPSELAFDGIEVFGLRIPKYAIIIIVAVALLFMIFRSR